MTQQKKHYPETTASPNFPEMEQEIQAFWQESGAFRASVEARPAQTFDANNEWVFYDGPPFANGLPHYGHLLTSYVKDMFARYHTMKGARVERRFGWDCHGLPAEMGAEKELNVSGRAAIEEYGIEKFNAHCRESVMKYTDIWQDYIHRAGRWVDFEHDYKTMDTDYMESVLWAFKKLWDKGLVYESHRVMPYSWAAQTPLSNFETRMDDAYRERTDKAVTVAFELEEVPEGALKADRYCLLAWTTTPWTLPSNLALAVSAEMEYVCVVTEKNSSPLATSSNPPPFTGGAGGGKKPSTRDPQALEKAQKLRKNLTKAEAALWNHLKSQQIDGCRFRKQQPVGPYIVDFVCNEKRLVIELDGGQHAEQQEQDAERTAFIEKAGYRVIRFWNNEVLENMDGVVQTIQSELKKVPPPAPPVNGGGLTEDVSGGGEGERVCCIMALSSLSSYEKELGLGDSTNLDDLMASKNESYEEIIKKAYQDVKDGRVFKGEKLIGLSYKPLFPYFAEKKQEWPNAFTVLEGDFIEEGSGTGIVHLAPGFGEDDQRVGAEAGIGIVCPVDEAGRYTAELFDLEEPLLSLKGLNVIAQIEGQCEAEPYKKDQLEKYGLANLRVVNWLKETGKLIKQEDYKHAYPHCWRTDKPLIYKAVPSWYVEVTKFRDRMVELNQNINWIPDHIKDGQFGKWLEGARDWSISRNRYWGCPIPVWRTESGKVKAFGSIAELEEFFGVEVKDLHKPFIDSLTKEEDGETWRRVPDVFDCWFESGSMPFAQVHYPFENKDWFEQHFPADFIVEYVGQTRGWFYTLMVLSTALFDREPFKNCICHGIILDAEGKKLSKKLRNYPDPQEMFDQYGSDAMRWRMVREPIMQGGNLLISKDGADIRDVVRLSLKPIWNAYHFFALYANTDGIRARLCCDSNHLMDRYILAKVKHAVEAIGTAMEAFDTPSACRAVDDFFEVLNNWYIRRSRERFWREVQMDADHHDDDKFDAYNTLYTCLHMMARAAAPLLPMLMEEIYLGLEAGGEKQLKDSVHLADFPADCCDIADEAHLVADMDLVREVCNAGLSVRNTENIRIRQPLARLSVYGVDQLRLVDFVDLIQDELNVKDVQFYETLEEAAVRELKLNFPVCGKRLGASMKAVGAAARQGDYVLEEDGTLAISGDVLTEGEFEFVLRPKEGVVGAAPLSGKNGLVVLDLEITPELHAEGVARDLVRMIQQARKDAGLHVSDRITLHIDAPVELQNAVTLHQGYIAEQTLATDLILQANSDLKHRTVQELEGAPVTLAFDVTA